MTDALHRYAVFETASGFCAVGWSAAGIARFQLPDGSAAAAERNMLRRLPAARRDTPPPEVAAVIAAAQRYFGGETVDFSDVAVDLAGQDEFFRRIYAATRAVGYGETTTYGTLAKALGAGPEAARDVGQAMAQNPVPLIIPCHRVLAAGGKVGGFSAPGGAGSKLKMLALEGIDLSPPPPAQQSLGF
jgi:methylated-DNA-[protein]-cysteine S-methyltransferase